MDLATLIEISAPVVFVGTFVIGGMLWHRHRGSKRKGLGPPPNLKGD